MNNNNSTSEFELKEIRFNNSIPDTDVSSFIPRDITSYEKALAEFQKDEGFGGYLISKKDGVITIPSNFTSAIQTSKDCSFKHKDTANKTFIKYKNSELIAVKGGVKCAGVRIDTFGQLFYGYFHRDWDDEACNEFFMHKGVLISKNGVVRRYGSFGGCLAFPELRKFGVILLKSQDDIIAVFSGEFVNDRLCGKRCNIHVYWNNGNKLHYIDVDITVLFEWINCELVSSAKKKMPFYLSHIYGHGSIEYVENDKSILMREVDIKNGKPVVSVKRKKSA